MRSRGPDRFWLRLTPLEIDPSWYDRYWLQERPPRPPSVLSRLVFAIRRNAYASWTAPRPTCGVPPGGESSPSVPAQAQR